MKVSTKNCPNCGNIHLVLISTQNRKYCTDCSTWIPWFLTEGQKTLYGESIEAVEQRSK